MAKDYVDSITIFIDNIHMVDTQSLSEGNEQNDQLIHNIPDGLAGLAKGTSVWKGHVESAIPIAGAEYDLDKAATERRNVEITIFRGDQSLTTKGWIQNVKSDWSIDKHCTISFDMVGIPATFS